MHSRELLILQPAATKPEELEELKEDRPFIMRGTIPAGAKFVQLLTIPTVVDMLGFSSGGGPPAFAYFFDPACTEEVQHVIWFVVAPGAPFFLPNDAEGFETTFLGVVQTLGMLLGALELRGQKGAVENLTEMFAQSGSMVFNMMPYKVPEFVKKRFFPHAEVRESAVRP